MRMLLPGRQLAAEPQRQPPVPPAARDLHRAADPEVFPEELLQRGSLRQAAPAGEAAVPEAEDEVLAARAVQHGQDDDGQEPGDQSEPHTTNSNLRAGGPPSRPRPRRPPQERKDTEK